ncbi:MAG: glycosyltransferase, partial [Desulfobacca sp.]|uniref:glycosyltransferase n=1 Tax=Desulfobacca sp. TaxID=2067990 RepID=UPI0040498E5E
VLAWHLWRRRIHILHVNSYVPGNYARLAAWLVGVPIIIDHWHGFTPFNRKRRVICRLLDRVTSSSLTVSAGVKEHLVQHLQLPPAKIRVLYNGIDLARCRPSRSRQEMRAALQLPVTVPVLAIVSRLDHWGKGHRELFQAMATLRPFHPVHCLVIGSGRRQGEMAALVRDMGLDAAVTFVGQRQDVPDLLGAADIFVLPSYSEGVSRSLLEAMALGLPVVVSEAGGSPEVVQHEVNGLLVPVKDPKTLAQAIGRLLDHPPLAARLGQAAAQRVAAVFSLERLAGELNALYDDLVQGWQGGHPGRQSDSAAREKS